MDPPPEWRRSLTYHSPTITLCYHDDTHSSHYRHSSHTGSGPALARPPTLPQCVGPHQQPGRRRRVALSPTGRSWWRLPSSRWDDVVRSGLVPGISRTLTYRVHARDLVNTLFPESFEFARKPAVLATGILVALCEWPAMEALRRFIRDDEDSLGTGVSLSHQAPVCAGTRLTITARCASIVGRVSRWDVCVSDGPQTVACGWVEFAVVHTATFLERHMLKPADSPALDRDLMVACD
jgi:fluoroacetyl-CoA thioesterase